MTAVPPKPTKVLLVDEYEFEKVITVNVENNTILDHVELQTMFHGILHFKLWKIVETVPVYRQIKNK